MERYIEHEYNNSIVLIPVDPSKALKVDFVPSKKDENIGDVHAEVGSLSFILYGGVTKDSSRTLIRDFVKKYKHKSSDKEYYSTTWVVLVSLCVVAIVLLASNYESSDASIINEFDAQTQIETFSPSAQTVEKLLEIPDQKVIDVNRAKSEYLDALEKMKTMNKAERQAFIQTDKMQELINTSWVNHIQGE